MYITGGGMLGGGLLRGARAPHSPLPAPSPLRTLDALHASPTMLRVPRAVHDGKAAQQQRQVRPWGLAM